MARHARFHLKDLDRLRAEMNRLGVSLPVEEDLSILGERVAIGRKETPNRFGVQPMEGFDAGADGAPGDLSFRRYTRYAEGGSGLIWFEATAVLAEARSNVAQFCLHHGNVGVFKRLVEATRQAAVNRYGRAPILIVQLTHSGRYSKPTGVPRPIIAHRSPVLDPIHGLGKDYPVVTDEYLDRLQETFVEAAVLAAEAGFDGVDVKSCHRYLVSELLASFTREGRYGGSFENRTRFLRETLAVISRKLPGLIIATRMNAYDGIGYPYGFGVDKDDSRVPDLREPIELAKKLKDLGISVLNLTIGNPYFNPHLNRPFDFPIHGANLPDEHPLEGIARFAEITRAIQESVPGLPVVATGYSWLRHLMPCVAAGVIKTGGATLIGQGRGAFAYPDSVNDILTKGRMERGKCCVACSACTQIMRDGAKTGCVVRDSGIYGPQYRLGRRFAPERLLAEAKRCRECEDPTCAARCPAHVNVPAFVTAYGAGDIKTAYDILRDGNVLPEMCARVCPSDVQCEGGCLESIFCGNPVPIRDIQLSVCVAACREGLTGVRLPEKESGKRVAIVGGGPAGIACAVKLLEMGHAVTLFEKGTRLGGTPDSIIPSERIQDSAAEVDAILTPATRAGRISIQTGLALGQDLTLEELNDEYDAVFLAVGLAEVTSLGRAEGVFDALTFLRDVKAGRLDALGDCVAVLGGGNTAMDAALAARKLGARDVYVLYRRSFVEMPAWPEERDKFLAAGGHLLLLTQPLGYKTDARGRMTGVRIARTTLGDPDDSGRRSPVVVPGSESVLEVNAVIEALGQRIPDPLRAALGKLSFTRRGLVKVLPGSCHTGIGRIFAGGDIVNGGTTAVQGVAEGMKAAAEIEQMLANA